MPPIAIKQHPSANAGLSGANIDLKPLKKNSLLIINRQGIRNDHNSRSSRGDK